MTEPGTMSAAAPGSSSTGADRRDVERSDRVLGLERAASTGTDGQRPETAIAAVASSPARMASEASRASPPSYPGTSVPPTAPRRVDSERDDPPDAATAHGRRDDPSSPRSTRGSPALRLLTDTDRPRELPARRDRRTCDAGLPRAVAFPTTTARGRRARPASPPSCASRSSRVGRGPACRAAPPASRTA